MNDIPPLPSVFRFGRCEISFFEVRNVEAFLIFYIYVAAGLLELLTIETMPEVHTAHKDTRVYLKEVNHKSIHDILIILEAISFRP